MNLHTLKPRPGSKHRVKRLGCGESSGHGKTAAKATRARRRARAAASASDSKAARCRSFAASPSAASTTRRSRRNMRSLISSDLECTLRMAQPLTKRRCSARSLIRGTYDGVKILGTGELTKKLSIAADKVSASAREKIEKAGGSIAISAAIARVSAHQRLSTPMISAFTNTFKIPELRNRVLFTLVMSGRRSHWRGDHLSGRQRDGAAPVVSDRR